MTSALGRFGFQSAFQGVRLRWDVFSSFSPATHPYKYLCFQFHPPIMRFIILCLLVESTFAWRFFGRGSSNNQFGGYTGTVLVAIKMKDYAFSFSIFQWTATSIQSALLFSIQSTLHERSIFKLAQLSVLSTQRHGILLSGSLSM